MLLQTPINKNKTLQELADAALKQVLDDTTADGVTIREWLEKISSGEYQQVKHGRWEEKRGYYGFTFYCSECGEVAPLDKFEERILSDFCPSCGAIMGEGAE